MKNKVDLWRINFFNDNNDLLKTDQFRYISSASSVIQENKNLEFSKVEIVFETDTTWDVLDEGWGNGADEKCDEARGT